MVKRIINWVGLKLQAIMFYISIALYNTEQDILKADLSNLSDKDKKNQRKRHRNLILEKFYAGQTDEKYVKEYYELLKKADKFIKNSTPDKIEMAAHMNHTNFGMKDLYGRRYEHYGFFDDKHKHSGKTLAEVLRLEIEERRTKDDDYELINIFNNKPIEVSLTKLLNVLEEENKIDTQSKRIEFPIKAYRDDPNNVVNKIEELTEFLHVKKIGLNYRQLEFFIPLKYKTNEIEENSEIFKDIININSIFVKDDYGELIGFGIVKLKKRIIYNDTHEVWKFDGFQMDSISK